MFPEVFIVSARPNLLWIVADQLRAQALSVYGDPNVHTPNIDRIAREGVRVTGAYSNYPVCMPYRSSLFTGQYPTTNGVRLHGDFLSPTARTVAHHFRDHGYRTSYVGKWHLAGEHGFNLVSGHGWGGEDFWVHPAMRGGFEDWAGFNLSNNYEQTYYCTGERVEAKRLDGYQTDALTGLSLEYLASCEQSPWFHVIAYETPHPGSGGTPRFPGYPVPAEYENRFDPASITLRENVPTDRAQAAREQLCGYYAMIENLDDNVGRILDWLDASGRAKDTIVVFTSDHGEMGGSQGLRNKEVPYDESIAIPFIVRVPERFASQIDTGATTSDAAWAGVTNDLLMTGVDVFPTSAGLCGIPIDAEAGGSLVEGLDLSRRLGGSADGPVRDHVFVQWLGTRFNFGDHPYRGLRTARYTYVEARDEAFRLLFDNEADPFQLDNLYHQEAHRQKRAELHERLAKTVREIEQTLPDWMSLR
ncbi:MAG: hypothetical protein EA383_07500 [Spirochaetaceae bacterium]|nr:MAG: hypothetical protein EA383_07500 [Spirochaetaceae bacterium]